MPKIPNCPRTAINDSLPTFVISEAILAETTNGIGVSIVLSFSRLFREIEITALIGHVNSQEIAINLPTTGADAKHREVHLLRGIQAVAGNGRNFLHLERGGMAFGVTDCSAAP